MNLQTKRSADYKRIVALVNEEPELTEAFRMLATEKLSFTAFMMKVTIHFMDKPKKVIPSFTECVETVKALPPTWYPAMLIELVEAAYKKEVYLPGGASHIVASVEKRIGRATK